MTYLDGTTTEDLDFATGVLGVTYTVRAIDESFASNMGCPGATHIRISRTGKGYCIGHLKIVATKPTRVPGWSRARLGYKSTFTGWQETDVLTGWIGV